MPYLLPPSIAIHGIFSVQFPQTLFKSSFVYLLAWHPPLFTPYHFSLNHCLLFAAHTPTIATCFAVVPRLCRLSLVFNPLLGLTPHIHLTILISACWSATSFSFLMPGLTSTQHNTLHTTAIQSPSHYQWYILIGKQWYQVPEFIPSNSNSGLCSCISISVCT